MTRNDPAVLHVLGQQAERQAGKLAPRQALACRKRVVVAQDQGEPLLVEGEGGAGAEGFVVEVADAGVDPEPVEAVEDLGRVGGQD